MPGLLAEWRQTGAIADAFLLNSVQGKDAPFRSVAVLQFPDRAAVEHWRQKGATHLGAGVIATNVDTLARGETFPRDSSKAIFLLAEYETAAAPEAYRKYVQNYVVLEMEELRTRKLLTSYFLFAARDKAAAPWHSILLMEYRDSVAFERRSQAMEEVRRKFASNAEFKMASDNNASIR